MTSPDFGRITELKDDPVLSMPSIRPLSPSTRNAWPSGMLKKLMSLTQTQCGPACGASCSALNGSAGSCRPAAPGGNPDASYREPHGPSCTAASRACTKARRPPARSGFQVAPHLPVTLRRPDARVAKTRGFIIRARNIERQAVIEDHPVAVFRPQSLADIPVDGFQVATGHHTFFHSGVELGDEVARPRKAARHGVRRLQRGSPTGHEFGGL